ncbi:hypothetical protein F2Q70_00015006 [Brassica cretica]|uniref:Uncharacterized protein n=1 Tax=Brassica cretica TaxID=69181 RepID=A0A8S9HZQ7_BRACR|nr:hypothetical protein F2Q70_00015006 [Brassica cretica]
MMKIRFSIGLGLGIAALLLVGLFFLPKSLDSHGELSVVSTVITASSSDIDRSREARRYLSGR